MKAVLILTDGRISSIFEGTVLHLSDTRKDHTFLLFVFHGLIVLFRLVQIGNWGLIWEFKKNLFSLSKLTINSLG